MNIKNRSLYSFWIICVLILVACTVLVGGGTRLTNSGLSITEWKPIMGAIPPMSENAWVEVFEKYKKIPEYEIENSHLTLEGFKVIYFWEWFHRNMGRSIGLVLILPFLLFYRRLNSELRRRMGIGILMVGFQGALGWFMVSSGLSERTDVSHYRLASHLVLAFFIFSHFLRILIDLNWDSQWQDKFRVPQGFRWSVIAVHSILGCQIIYGAFVAGLRAGYMYNTFPKMGEFWIPWDSLFLPSFFIALVENPVTVQFIHRWLAWGVVFGVLFLLYYGRICKLNKEPFRLIWVLLFCVLIQLALGVLTLVLKMPLAIALLHQLGGLVTFGVMTTMMHLCKSQKNVT